MQLAAKGGRPLEAISLFKRAVELDRDFALAYSGLSARYAGIAHPEKGLGSVPQGLDGDPAWHVGVLLGNRVH